MLTNLGDTTGNKVISVFRGDAIQRVATASLSTISGSSMVFPGHARVQEDKKVAIYCETCPEWMMICQACWSQSITVVTVYANVGEEGLTHALKETEMTYIFTSAGFYYFLYRVAQIK